LAENVNKKYQALLWMWAFKYENVRQIYLSYLFPEVFTFTQYEMVDHRGEYFPLFCNFCYGIVFGNSKLSEQFFKIPKGQEFYSN